MLHLIINAVRWIFRHFISFVVVLAVLVGGPWFVTQLSKANAARDHLKALQMSRPALGSELISASKQLEAQIKQVATLGHVGDKAKHELDQLIKKKTAERNAITSRSLFDGLPTINDFKRLAILDMEIATLKKASEEAKQLASLIRDASNGREQWSKLSEEHLSMRRSWANKAIEKAAICEANPIKCKVPSTDASDRIAQITAEQARLTKDADELRRQIVTVKYMLELKEQNLSTVTRTFGLDGNSVESALTNTDEQLKSFVQKRSESFFWAAAEDFWPAVMEKAPTALGIVIAAILTPIGIKLFFFFVIAPWAARQAPINVLPCTRTNASSSGPLFADCVQTGKHSAVSVAVEVKPTEKLLLHSDYIQSSSTSAGKTTKWLLDWAFPLTSIAAGLYALTRIAPQQAETVIVSSTNDPLMEVAVIEVQTASALVLQPRALVGVLQQRSTGSTITSHWRIFHLHSWLTLQFRYLAFHGPCKLIVRGCRGIRIEPADGGRLINQAATLGFSANADYSVSRCETFVAYWRGIDELFNDRFSGDGCVYVYEEMPSLRRKSGITGRGLEGLTDSVLKVFGV